MTAIHQLLPVLSPGDAIGNSAFGTQRMLRSLGFESEIFADLIHQELISRARPTSSLDGSLASADALVYHLSIGSPLARAVAGSSAKKILLYHNITPSEYYRGISPRVAYWLDRGRRDLHRLAPIADLTIGVSHFNLAEAQAAGARRGVVIPPALDLARLSPTPATPVEPPVVLFVGRIAPNKRHDTLIRAVAAMRALCGRDVRLRLIGGAGDTERYLSALRRLARDLDVADIAEVGGKAVMDSDLSRAYRGAAVFACASEHEGFCVPIVEAMAFGLPVVARASGGVPETLGDAGLLIDGDDPVVWAALIARVLDDRDLRGELASRGRSRVSDFAESRLRGMLGDALATIGLRAGGA